ncbi:MAG: membrane dipeptidase [Phycisphaerales bacterium]|nr:MAG: membrane dipeptidase [Phycisphaerales bacterium]
MHWIDGHLDLAYLAICGRDLTKPVDDPNIGCISLPAMREAQISLAFGTIFTDPDPSHPASYAGSEDVAGAEAAGRVQIAVYKHLDEAGEIRLVRGADELDLPGAEPKIIILMEGADPIGTPDDLPSWHEAGVRMIGLAWAAGSRYAGGNNSEGGLTVAGRDLVRAMDELGVIHDASHLNDASFDDLMESARGRIVATHSNCRALTKDSQRMLRDDQIKAIADRDGIVGLNLYGPQLVDDRRATIADCVAHVERVCELMGHKRGTALGSDMDGGFGPPQLPQGLEHPSRLIALAEALRDAGWSDGEVEGFCHANWMRFLRGAMPGHQ